MQEAVTVTSPGTNTGGRRWLRNEQSPLWASVPTERPVINSSRLPYISATRSVLWVLGLLWWTLGLEVIHDKIE